MHEAGGGAEWQLQIQDDGIGGAAAKPGHTGLPGFSERMKALGGHWELESPSGLGTRLRFVAKTVALGSDEAST